MQIKRIFAVLLTALLLNGSAATLVASVSYADPEASDKKGAKEAELYENGTDAIDDEEWDAAVKSFRKVAEMNGSRADGALYWIAYALAKQGRRNEALQTVAALEKTYPKSRWIDDAKALSLEVRQSRGERVSPDAVDDDELKVMAIRSLMQSDPERAYPLLAKIVSSVSSSKEMKEQALFVLSQSNSPKAQELIGSIARGKANPSLQKEAVHYLAIAGGERNRQMLADIYANAGSQEVKKEVLQAFMISGDRARVLNAAKGERDPELREDAIHLLGVMGARAELRTMYANESSKDVREAALEALFIAGDVDTMAEVARTEKDSELRQEAIHRLGLMGGKTAPLLLSFYTADASEDIKEAVINALFLQNNAKALIDLSKKEKDRSVRREILQKLSVMNNNKDAVDYMLQILNED